MPATSYFEGLILNHALLQSPYSIEDWYVGLWFSDPTSAGLMDEVTAADYQRKSVSWSPTFGNLSQINWPGATSNWGTVLYICLVNSSIKGSGNVLVYEATSQPFTVTIGRPLEIPAGGLTLSAAA